MQAGKEGVAFRLQVLIRCRSSGLENAQQIADMVAAAEQHGIAELAKAREELAARTLALNEQRPRASVADERVVHELARHTERTQRREQQERAPAARLEEVGQGLAPVVDREAAVAQAIKPLNDNAQNYPMALDEVHQRLFVGCREPAQVLVMDIEPGVAVVPEESDYVERILDQPHRWRKSKRIFVGSMTDLFHEDVPVEWIKAVLEVITLCPEHTFMVLTKRPERMRAVMSPETNLLPYRPTEWPLPNLWLGVTAENQAAVAKILSNFGGYSISEQGPARILT